MAYSRADLNKTTTQNRAKWVRPAVKQIRAGSAETTGGFTTDAGQS